MSFHYAVGVMAEEPPYLSVDTDVSAKYKGAFCEAKIRKVVRSVKCKVLFKQGWGSATVPDDQIRGPLRIGAVVEAKHPERKEFAEATITKIQDCSQYTVVFDDGDITTLRRTALCLKSGRHFAESDTLDQLPLTHPEHFSNPVIGGRRGRRRLDENSEDEELLLISGSELEDEREEHIGRVVCVEGSEKKKQKDNWFPGLVVAPTAQDNVPIHVKEEYLVRSFKDGRYYTVPKKEANEFTREVGARAEHPTLKAAVDKALLYLDRDELPPHWDRDLLLYGFGEVNSADNDGSLDYESSDDEPREEKDHFVAQLYKFMDDSGTPINKGPTIGTRDVDLYKLFKVVQNQGGYNRVTNHNNWKLVALKMGFGQNHITVNLVKLAYKKFLFTFEEFYRKLGCTLLNHPSRLSRSCCRGGRNLIRNKDQGSSSTSVSNLNKADTKVRQTSVKDGKVVQGDVSLSVTKIKLEKIDEYIPVTPEEEIPETLPEETSLGPTNPPLPSRDRPKRVQTAPHSPPLKVPLPIKIKLEPGTSTSGYSLSSTCVSSPPTVSSPISSIPSPSQSSQNVAENSRPSSPINVVQSTSTAAQKKEPRARQIKKPQTVITPIENAPNATQSITSKEAEMSDDQSNSSSPPQVKEKKRRAAFPRAVVAAKKLKQQQHSTRVSSPQPPGLAASRTKRSVNKDRLRTIVKNLKSKWATSSPTPATNVPEQSSVKMVVKSKTKEDAPNNNVKCKKDEVANNHSSSTSDDKKKGGRKRKDNRVSEDRFVPLPSYKTILLGDKLRVYYGPTLESKVTYEAKVLSIRTEGNESVYLVHYTGWNNRYDEWIKTSRIADNLSWVPGRSARKTNQTPKTPKKKGAHSKTESAGVGKDNVTNLSSNSISANKGISQPFLVSATKKAITRASTRAANKKENPLSEPYESYDSIEAECSMPKKPKDSEITKLQNEMIDKKKSRRRKTEVKQEEPEVKMEEEEDGDDGTADNISECDVASSKTTVNNKPMKSEVGDKESNEEEVDKSTQGNHMSNVIIVDVDLKNESEEESLPTDENSVAEGAQVIEGYNSVIESDNNREENFKVLGNQTGRDFDLTQIRSELKGIEATVSRSDEAEESEATNTVDIYEFKEPEFESIKSDEKGKQRRSGIGVRMFESKESGDEIEAGSDSGFNLTGTTSEPPQDDRPIIKTCEEAFDRVCAEPLRAATERPPAGFLFIQNEEDEDDVYDDDDSQDRLIISERDSDNEVSGEVSIILPAREQQPLCPINEQHTKNIPTVENESDKEALLSKEDDEEGLEDELLNVVIQRAMESSDDTSDGDLLSRPLGPKRIFNNDFSNVGSVENKTELNNEQNAYLKIGLLPTNKETPAEVEGSKEPPRTSQSSAIDLSQGTEDIQERVEVVTQDEMECDNELVNQEEPESENVDTIDMESNLDADCEEGEDGDEIEEEDLIPVVENITTSSQNIAGRGPHTPPGPAPRTPPEPPEPEEDFNEGFEDQYEDTGEVEGERDEPPPLLTREVEVAECDVRQEEIDGNDEDNDEDNDETNLVSLLCEETIPGSPAAAVHSDGYQLSPEVADETFRYTDNVAKNGDETTPDKELMQKDTPNFETTETPVTQVENVNPLPSFRTAPQGTSQTPLPSPTSSLSSNSPPRARHESPPNEEVVQPEVPVTCQNDQFQESCSVAQIPSTNEEAKPAVIESLRTRKAETRSSGKKSRRSRKRSEETSKKKFRTRHHGSESDDNCESTSRGYQRRSRTPPRLRKYSFIVHLSPDMDPQQRVNKIQNALTDVRKAHASVKSELASIERRRKKLRRREREFRL